MPLPIELLGIDLKHPNLDLEQLLLVVGDAREGAGYTAALLTVEIYASCNMNSIIKVRINCWVPGRGCWLCY